MMKMLVPISFSDYSINALKYITELSKKLSCEFILLHCFSENFLSENSDGDGPPEYSPKSKDEAAQKLNYLIETLKKETNTNAPNHTYKYIIEEGYPQDIILQQGNDIHPHAIIMGTKSKDETIKELLGSITNDIILKATCPVFAIPAHCQSSDVPLNHIMFLTAFDNFDYDSIHKLIRITSPFNTAIHSVHFSAENPSPKDEEKLINFQSYCNSTYRNHTIESSFIQGNNFAQAIDLFIKDQNITIIALTKRKRSMIYKLFHPDITRKILFHTDIPLLVFHE